MMTDYQFSEWVAYHAARFTKVAADFAAMPEQQRCLVRDVWAETLRPISLADAKAASDELFNGDGRPPFFDRIPATVRAIATRMASDRVQARRSMDFARSGGELTINCQRCDDLGQVVVCVTGALLNLAIQQCGGNIEKASRRTEAVLCDCEAGRRLQANHKRLRQRMISWGDVLSQPKILEYQR